MNGLPLFILSSKYVTFKDTFSPRANAKLHVALMDNNVCITTSVVI